MTRHPEAKSLYGRRLTNDMLPVSENDLSAGLNNSDQFTLPPSVLPPVNNTFPTSNKFAGGVSFNHRREFFVNVNVAVGGSKRAGVSSRTRPSGSTDNIGAYPAGQFGTGAKISAAGSYISAGVPDRLCPNQ